ncbi:MAG: hypothetical protein CL677_10735 [Bdellovibrionaceae bacterium]|nr:hypothetical protein [Pseudobdellovibrionaceae bacterium]|tara:strand:- start:30473 stop:31663 length:1191 start_codon:yes stop_codon:yes gene_type:complete
MIRLVLGAVLSLAFMGTAFANEVNPTERLGRLKISIPDPVFLSYRIELDKLSFHFSIDGQTKQFQLDEVQDVAAGRGCLNIRYRGAYYYRVDYCGVVIEPLQLKELKLSSFNPFWDDEFYDVDFGPEVKIKLSSVEENITFETIIDPRFARSVSHFYILPAGEVKLEEVHPDVADLHSRTYDVPEGRRSSGNFIVPDTLGTVDVKFVDGAPRYEMIDNHYMLINYRANPWIDGYSRVSIEATRIEEGQNTSSIGWVPNFYRLNHSGRRVILKARSLRERPGLSYEFSANEQAVDFKLHPGQRTVLNVATINVNHYDTEREGKFYMNHILDSTEDTYKRILMPKVRGESVILKSVFLNTQRSLFLPMGSTYRFDFFAVDDLGRNTLQDQVVVDLTEQ